MAAEVPSLGTVLALLFHTERAFLQRSLLCEAGILTHDGFIERAAFVVIRFEGASFYCFVRMYVTEVQVDACAGGYRVMSYVYFVR